MCAVLSVPCWAWIIYVTGMDVRQAVIGVGGGIFATSAITWIALRVLERTHNKDESDQDMRIVEKTEQ
jgi:hypothetical protein